MSTNKVKVKSNEKTYIMNLEDIPHGNLIGSKDFEDGRHIDFYEALPGTQVIAYDEKTGEPKWVNVSGWSKHTGIKVELVQLSNGDTITTDNDPRAVYGMSIKAQDFEMTRATPTEALRNKFIIPVVSEIPELTPEFSSIDILNGGDPSNDTPLTSAGIIKADYTAGEVIGVLAGDGWWDKKDYIEGDRSFYLADLEGFNAKLISDWASSRFGKIYVGKKEFKKDDDESRYGDTIRWTFRFAGSTRFCKALTEMLGGEGDDYTSGSANKHLPYWFLSMSRDFRLGLLNGLIATDGSVSLSTSGKRKYPELLIQFSSTSRRLVEDVKSLCSTLDIRSSITFSKVTRRNNISWVLTLSSIDCKRIGAFDDCSHTRKRDIFRNAVVADNSNSNRGNIVPMPLQVSSILKGYVKSRAKISKPVIPSCPLQDYILRGNSIYQTIYQYKDKGYVPRDLIGRLCDWWEETNKVNMWFDSFIKEFQAKLINGIKVFDPTEVNTLVESLNFNSMYFKKEDVLTACALAGRLRQKGTSFPSSLKDTLDNVTFSEQTTLFNPLSKDPVIRKWVELSTLPIKWVFIENVQKTDKIEDGYDLTVPGYETFASAGGVVLSNTMTYYVPVSDKAVKEAYKLMTPSANQLSARDFTALPELQEELVSGAYLASHKKKTPPKAIFDTKAEAAKAYREGKIDVDDNIIIRELQK